jgi:ornithine carbamoyltransferase
MNFLKITDFTKKQVQDVFSYARDLKEDPYLHGNALNNKTIVMFFTKPSTRTRLSFEIGIKQLGGNPIYVDANTTQTGRGETIGDTAKVIDRYAHSIVARLHAHADIEEFSYNFNGPVVNALTDLYHPCQALADLYTLREKFGKLKGKTLSYVGNADNNVTHSLLLGSAMMGVNMRVGAPKSLFPNPDVVKEAKALAQQSRAEIEIMESAKEAVEQADVVYTDVWVSMGEEEKEGVSERKKLLAPYQINHSLLELAGKDTFVMHCLPAHRGDEISSSVADSEKSIIFDQAENRLHVQKALLLKLFGET